MISWALVFNEHIMIWKLVNQKCARIRTIPFYKQTVGWEANLAVNCQLQTHPAPGSVNFREFPPFHAVQRLETWISPKNHPPQKRDVFSRFRVVGMPELSLNCLFKFVFFYAFLLDEWSLARTHWDFETNQLQEDFGGDIQNLFPFTPTECHHPRWNKTLFVPS